MKGHVRKRGNKWCFVLDLKSDDGKRRQKWFSGYRTQKEAEKAMAKMITEINEGTYIEPSKEKFSDFLATWLELKKTKVRQTTFDTYNMYTKNHILPTIGHYRLDQLNAVHLEKLYINLSQHLAAKSILKVHEIIRNALGYAKTKGFVRENVALLAETPKVTRKEMKVWNEEEVRRFLEVAKGDRLYIAFHLALTTGMRRGEILGLRWKDIDVKNKMLSINQTLSKDGSHFQPAKSEGSYRSIALAQSTLDELAKHYKMVREERFRYGREYQNLDLVVCTTLGTKVLPRNLSRKWYSLLKKADVSKIRFHDLRHTHATLMLKQGIHPKIVSERLGHSSVQITLDTYSHILPGLQEAAAAKFDENLFGVKNKSQSI
ncbi:site-specific integrase [Fictibacillus sp. Mic-4]|uniref:site-specific integrase n=1 Tax=Fictibacillus sp. Mic-4 TaxID=3132826 RepID=UPI003CEB4897